MDAGRERFFRGKELSGVLFGDRTTCLVKAAVRYGRRISRETGILVPNDAKLAERILGRAVAALDFPAPA